MPISAMLRNINLSSSRNRASLKHALHEDVDGGQGGSTGGPSQHAYLAESSAETSAERSQSTVEPKKAKKRTRKNSKHVVQRLLKPWYCSFGSRKTSSAQFLALALHASVARAMHIDTLAHGTARGIIRMHTPINHIP